MICRCPLCPCRGLLDYWDSPSFIEEFEGDPQRFWTPLEGLRHAAAMARGRVGKHHYADTNYVLLGLLIEERAGEPPRPLRITTQTPPTAF
jgi:CubicO group peptidase (beta-lactamase class C family)